MKTLLSALLALNRLDHLLLVMPILTQLKSLWRNPLDIQTRLLTLLDPLRGGSEDAQGYGTSNLVTLLRLLRGDLSGLDLADLYL
jgi:hypothetical protein